MNNVVEFNNVWKKFQRGEKFNSIRDSIPNFFRKKSPRILNKDELSNQEFWAVKNVNFAVNPGEVVGVIGPNGAGKSTILKLLSQIMKPTKGNMNIKGRLSALIEVTAGFHPELTGRENVYLNGTILGMKKNEIDAKFDDILEFSGLSEFIDTPIKRYSSGMYSRLGFSVAAHIEPDVLLVDEVLAVGDISFQSKCAEKMRELMNSGTTIMLVSHNLQLVQSLCKRVILLDQGEVLKEGAPHEIIPYYESIVFRQKEEELKQKMEKTGYKVGIKTESEIEVLEFNIANEQKQKKESFEIGEKISLKIRYKTKKKIDKPLFRLEVIRGDGVLCCSSDARSSNFNIEFMDGEGTAIINMGDLNLAPGLYALKFSVWDKDLVHSYIVRNKDILKIQASASHRHTGAVFQTKMDWRLAAC